MNTQQSSAGSKAAESQIRAVPAGRVLALEGGGGEVSVLSGRVWLTRAGDLDDHVLGPGESIDVKTSRGTLIEAWGRNASAQIVWRPRSFVERLRSLL